MRALEVARRHFELLIYVYFWLAAAGLAALAGRPALGAIGLVTVVPFVIAYVARNRAATRARGAV